MLYLLNLGLHVQNLALLSATNLLTYLLRLVGDILWLESEFSEFLQCFNVVGWATASTYSLQRNLFHSM